MTQLQQRKSSTRTNKGNQRYREILDLFNLSLHIIEQRIFIFFTYDQLICQHHQNALQEKMCICSLNLLSCNINIMGNQLCPGSTKDFIQGFRELEKGQKQYHPLFKCCMNNETVQAQELLPLIDYFQERDKLLLQSTLENSKIHPQTLIREENQDQVQFQRHPKSEKHQVHSPLVKEVVDLAFPDGWGYKGEAIGFIPEGQGQEHGPNGEHFIGMFLKGKKQGYGTYRYANGTVYKGEFKQNMMWGFGIFQFTNGDRFEGQFVKNVREGKGKYILPQPNIQDLLYFQGEYKNDMKNGPGVMKYVGYEVHGFWKDGNYDFNFQSQHNEVY